MRKLKSHFWYTKNQRNGILLLLGIISVLQIFYHFVNFRDEGIVDVNQAKIISFQNTVDSLKLLELENRQPKIYPFNPNYITDYKGYQLGMKTIEIDRLHKYRKKRLFVNSAKEFQSVTKVSDSILQKIAPYFKFPDWVNSSQNKNSKKRTFDNSIVKSISEIFSTDINLASQNDFLTIQGVDENLSERIIKYRTKLQGFSISEQLYEVWGLQESTGKQILETFSINTIPVINKININTATFKEVLSNPYIDYDLCLKIFNYKDEVAELQSITELKNIEGFPLKKYERIVLYLQAE